MRVAAWTLMLGALSSAPASAQIDRRIPVAAIDARGFFAGLKPDATTAENLEVTVDELPTRALGGVGGAHVYVWRHTRMALGVGGEFLIARGQKQLKDAEGMPAGVRVARRLQSLSTQISVNFGQRGGWSYLAGGIGPMVYETFTGELPPADEAPRKATINMGGGARWFYSRHVAFCFDVRFYLTRPTAIVGAVPGRQRARLLVLSAGVSFK